MSHQPSAVRGALLGSPVDTRRREMVEVLPQEGRVAPGMEVLGLALLVANIWWVYAASASVGGAPLPVAALFLACGAAYAVARLGGLIVPWLVPSGLVVAAAVLAATTPDLLSRTPLSGPFGYVNAKGAFFAQAVIAALFVAFASKRPLLRFLGTASAGWFVIVPFSAGSLTPAILLIIVIPVIVAAYRRRAARALVLALAGLFVLVLAITAVLGSRHWNEGRAGPLGRALHATVTERRLVLWHDALVLIRLNPRVGVGPGRFGQFSPTARMYRDAEWAHNEFLQHGAETGILGLVLLCLAFLWGFARLWKTAEGRPAVLGAAALMVLGVNASVDYVMHFPLVPIFAATLVGAGISASRQGVRSSA
jgi:O-antigen ligase